MKVDLHCHSTASDGVLSPAALVERAHEQGVYLLALTDHDTLAGLEPARIAANKLGVHLLNGIELSCIWGGATIHVLGYDFSADNKGLQVFINEMLEIRRSRAKLIAERLAKAGFPNALEGARAIQRQLGDTQMPPARPHFARFMVEAGYATDTAEVFRKWLGAGKIGDVKQCWPELERIMQELNAAGAWISLAHPYQYSFTRSKRRRLVQEFTALGGHALEVSNGLQPAEQVGTISALAREFSLAATAGSDFHRPRAYCELGLYRTPAAELELLWQRFSLPPEFKEVSGDIQ